MKLIYLLQLVTFMENFPNFEVADLRIGKSEDVATKISEWGSAAKNS